MKTVKSSGAAKSHGLVLLAVILAVLFWKSFLPGYVHFSNDGPLGQQNTEWSKLPGAFTGVWGDLNGIGNGGGSFPLGLSSLLRWALGPVGYAKFLAPFALFILGAGAGTFFRQLKLSPLAATLGALAAALNSAYFADACWGTASHQIAIGMDFFALALVVSNSPGTPALVRWTRLALAGLAVGINVIEAADIGAIFSLCVAAFVFYKAIAETDGSVVPKIGRGIGSVLMIAVFAGFMATQTVVSLVSTQIQGVAGTGQDAETKAAHWYEATQWSEPKIETLGLFVPGLFGYKMDTPNYMEYFHDAYRGGSYWGAIGRDPSLDQFFENGAKGTLPPFSYMRQTGGGDYAGILVALVAAWAIAQSLRRQNSVFGENQRRMIWFWFALLVISLLLAFGRFGFFDGMPYRLLYALPYFSTIRNPDKFIHVFSWAIVILFAYGVHALHRRYLETPVVKITKSSVAQAQSWWKNLRGFDRKWTFGCGIVFAVSVLAWLVYASQKPALIRYLQIVQAPGSPSEIAAFSIGQAGWFLLFFATAILLFILIIAGFFSGPRSRFGGILLGALLVVDLGRADLPYIIHWDYFQKYDIDPANPANSTNPIINFLRDKPYKGRVTQLPFRVPDQFTWFDGNTGLYAIEWMQHHFPYYNIQSSDIVQQPRTAADLMAYNSALALQITRRWELNNTRYLLGPAGFLDAMNEQLDPVQHRFRILQRFQIAPKPGIEQPTKLEELTAVLDGNGDYALFEFTGALPRAKLYTDWQVCTNNSPAAAQWLKTMQEQLPKEMGDAIASCSPNDLATLYTLTDTNFDPQQTVLLSAPLPSEPAPIATNANSGTVEFTSYAPKDIVLDANADAPSILLLNDKYDPNWKVTVDGKPAQLLRCNFIMRGVCLTPGEHTVEFQFSLPHRPLYITLTAIVVGILLCGFLFISSRRAAAPAAT
jgi:hypothetical protein